MKSEYGIRELAGEFQVTPRTLRFYEAKGLLTPLRQGRTRRYSEQDRVRLKLTLRGKRIGLSLQDIKEIIDMYDPLEQDDSRQLLHLCNKISGLRGDLLGRVREIEATLSAMDEVEANCLAKLMAAPQFNC
jgi:DNA-binding transcriptional MerR regulator